LPKVVPNLPGLKNGGVFIYDTFNRTLISKLVAIKIGRMEVLGVHPPISCLEDVHKPRELKSLLQMNHLRWMEIRAEARQIVFLIQRFCAKEPAEECRIESWAKKSGWSKAAAGGDVHGLRRQKLLKRPSGIGRLRTISCPTGLGRRIPCSARLFRT